MEAQRLGSSLSSRRVGGRWFGEHKVHSDKGAFLWGWGAEEERMSFLQVEDVILDAVWRVVCGLC